jgi:hypothetical protein
LSPKPPDGELHNPVQERSRRCHRRFSINTNPYSIYNTGKIEMQQIIIVSNPDGQVSLKAVAHSAPD